jgi:orotidine 5'-phosphate decarboxylase subfamily 1
MNNPSVMVALDLNRHWAQAPYDLGYRLKLAQCTHYKVHDPFPTMDLRATAHYLRTSVQPGKSATVMLDNKEHDILSRVLKAVENHVRMGFHLTTVHAMCGREVLTALADEFGDHVVAVTTLTSMQEKDLRELYGGRKSHAQMELHLGRIAFDCGIRAGLVCSAPGVPALKKYVKDVPFMTPGIYLPSQGQPSDQRWAATPKQAVDFGSNCLIVGRSILGSDDVIKKIDGAYRVVKRGVPVYNPEEMYRQVLREAGIKQQAAAV